MIKIDIEKSFSEKLYIIMPAYNEEENIETVVQAWYIEAEKTGTEFRFLVVDDGSTDSTYSKLISMQEKHPFLRVKTKENGGHGAAILFGYQYAVNNGADFIFQTDSDGQTLPEEFGQFWKNREDFDVQIGFRKKRQDGFSRMIVTKILHLFLFVFFRIWTKDANTPFRLMTGESVSELLPKIPEDYRLTNVLFTVLYEKLNYKMRYVPISFLPRQGGVNSINLGKIFKIGLGTIREFFTLRKDI